MIEPESLISKCFFGRDPRHELVTNSKNREEDVHIYVDAHHDMVDILKNEFIWAFYVDGVIHFFLKPDGFSGNLSE